jgi:hypothetical protein
MEVVSAEQRRSPGAGQGPSDAAPHTAVSSFPGTTPVPRVMPRVLGAEVRQQEHDMRGGF